MSEKLIRLSNLSMTFEDGETILDGINLYINNKEFLTLLGPSGCGKTTTLRIIGGFLCGVLFGTLLAIFAVNHTKFEELIAPLILLIKTIPVASFIILVLIFISSKNLSVMISFLMVLPIVYTNVRNGILETDRNLLEMASVFALSRFKKFRYIYVPQVFPYFQSACSVCLGLAFKSGIAAEVIGIPTGSIGEQLYNAKIYLNKVRRL